MDISNVKIKTDGTYKGTEVEINGEKIGGIMAMTIRFDKFKHLASVELEVIAPQIDFEGVAEVELTEVEPDAEDD